MKNSFYMVAAALVLLSGCNKEADKAPERTPGKTYTITASVENPSTRSITALNETTDKYEFSWTENERIAVLPDGNLAKLTFKVVNPANGTFSYTARPDEPEYSAFGMAVTPADALSYDNDNTSFVDGTDVDLFLNLSGVYYYGQSNAVMVAGAPTTVGEYQKFSFHHAAALAKVTYENVPADASYMVFSTPDHAITGTFHFTSLEGVELVAGASQNDDEAWVILQEGDVPAATADFYLPIPTGNYTTFNVCLKDADDKIIAGSDREFKTSGTAFTVARADVVEFPVITLTPSPDRYYTKVTSSQGLTNAQYLIVYESGSVAFNGGLETLDAAHNHISVVITENGILSTETTDAAAFTISATDDGFSILSASGQYIGRSENKNGLNVSETALKNFISFEENGDATITATGDCTLRFNNANGDNNDRFRYYKSGQQPVALYKLEDNRTALATPQNLAVNADTKVVTWDAVTDADSYEVTVGTTTETVSETTYTFTGTDGYYDVSVVAVPASTDTEHKKSAAATLVDAKFGTPALATPVLTKGEVNETSIEVTWTLDENAVNGYACEIYQGETKLDKDQTVTAGSVTFEGLIQNVTYTIKVKAIAVSGEKPYAESETASIDITTDEAVTISKLLEDGTTSDNVTLPSATVMAKQGNYTVLSDDTGSILAYKASGTYEIGDVVEVVGKIGTYGNAYQFNNGTTITKKSDGEAVYPAENVISTEALLTAFATGEEGSVRVTYATLRGVSNAGKLKIGTKTITVYNSIPTQFNDENVQVTGYLTGWKDESSALSIYFVRIGDVTLNESDPRLSVTSPETKVLNWAWNENGNEKAKVISLDINGEATGYTVTFADAEDNPVSDPSADWNITNDATAKTITVYPVSEATSAGKVLKVIIAHNDDPTLSETVTLTQTAAPEHEITINPATNPIVLSGTQDTPYTVTVTSNYAWNATTTGTGFSVNPASGNAGETTVTITPSANGGNAETELGTLTFTDAVDNSVSSSFTVKQAAYVATATYTYTFNSKSWGAKLNDNDANWTSGKDGNSFQNNQGVQVTTGVSGANATSPKAFTGVSKIKVTYCTNASKGAGTIKVKIGKGSEKSFSVTAPKSGGTTLKTTEFEFSPNESGAVKLTAECTTNSVYIYSIAITAAGIDE